MKELSKIIDYQNLTYYFKNAIVVEKDFVMHLIFFNKVKKDMKGIQAGFNSDLNEIKKNDHINLPDKKTIR